MKNVRRIHYNTELLRRGHVHGTTKLQKPDHKPKGLWYSVEWDGEDSYGWKDWCTAEDFELEHLEVATKLDLDLTHVLQLHTPEEILEFHERFTVNLYPDVPQLAGSGVGQGIDWPRVATLYKAIEIAPYCWQLRLDSRTFWYYGWDCASGCIWDPTIIKGLEEYVV